MAEQPEHWHLDKRVPIALIVAIAVQSTAAVWWAATQTARVDAVERTVLTHDQRIDALDRASAAAAVLAGRMEAELAGIRNSLTRIDRAQERTNDLLQRYLEGRP